MRCVPWGVTCRSVAQPCVEIETAEVYYFNVATAESSWEHPCDAQSKQLYLAQKVLPPDLRCTKEAAETRMQHLAAIRAFAGLKGTQRGSAGGGGGGGAPSSGRRPTQNACMWVRALELQPRGVLHAAINPKTRTGVQTALARVAESAIAALARSRKAQQKRSGKRRAARSTPAAAGGNAPAGHHSAHHHRHNHESSAMLSAEELGECYTRTHAHFRARYSYRFTFDTLKGAPNTRCMLNQSYKS